MTAICCIPARGGSVRVPRKNIRLFHGKPIIAYSIECAKASGVFDKILVSTDDKEVAAVAEQYGAKVWWRPLDDGTKGTQEVMADVLNEHPGYQYACCLYATAPMLQAKTLLHAYQSLVVDASRYVVPVGEWLKDPGQFYFGIAAAFVVGASLIDERTMLLPVDPNTCCDINTEEDWKRAEQMFLRSKHGNSGVLEG